MQTDKRLARRASEGDRRAFAAIFNRYGQDLYRFCVAILGNADDAQDALQNTMLSALRALPGEARELALKPWLYRIAHNESIDIIRRRRLGEPLDPDLSSTGPSLPQEVENRERLRGLLGDLDGLPERQRSALVMRELSGLGFDEISAAIGCTPAVARQTVYEARLGLRQMEAGREMDCDAITRVLSDADGRVLRRRDVRAHLRTCRACREFRAGIETRSRMLASIAPLPAAAAGLFGAAGAGAGAANGIAGSVLIKGVATVAVAGAIGIGADRAHVVDLGIREAGPPPAQLDARAAPSSTSVSAEPAAGRDTARDRAGDPSLAIARPTRVASVEAASPVRAAPVAEPTRERRPEETATVPPDVGAPGGDENPRADDPPAPATSRDRGRASEAPSIPPRAASGKQGKAVSPARGNPPRKPASSRPQGPAMPEATGKAAPPAAGHGGGRSVTGKPGAESASKVSSEIDSE